MSVHFDISIYLRLSGSLGIAGDSRWLVDLKPMVFLRFFMVFHGFSGFGAVPWTLRIHGSPQRGARLQNLWFFEVQGLPQRGARLQNLWFLEVRRLPQAVRSPKPPWNLFFYWFFNGFGGLGSKIYDFVRSRVSPSGVPGSMLVS